MTFFSVLKTFLMLIVGNGRGILILGLKPLRILFYFALGLGYTWDVVFTFVLTVLIYPKSLF